MFRAPWGTAWCSTPPTPCPPSAWWRNWPKHHGIAYMRTTRMATPILYGPEEQFPLGGCKVLRQSDQDLATVVGAGVTLFEALAAYDTLKKMGIAIRVIDLYSIKPIDAATLADAAQATGHVITVEDHYPGGGHRRSGNERPGHGAGAGLFPGGHQKAQKRLPGGTPEFRGHLPGGHCQEGARGPGALILAA